MRRPGPPTVTEAAILNWRESAWARTPLAGRAQRTTDGRPSGPPNGRLWARHSPALGERNQSAIESSSPVVAAKRCARLKRGAPRARRTKLWSQSQRNLRAMQRVFGQIRSLSLRTGCAARTPSGPSSGPRREGGMASSGSSRHGRLGALPIGSPTRRVQMRCAVRSCRGG